MSILRHGVAREVRTGLSLLTPEKHRRIFLLAAFLLLLAGPARAGIWPSRCLEDSLPGAHATTCTSMPSCDIPELLAASRAWAYVSGPKPFTFAEDIRRDVEQRWRKAIEACGK